MTKGKQQPKKETNYKVVLKMCGKEYVQEAETIDEALAKLGLSWNNIKGKGVIAVSKGKQTYEKLFYTQRLRQVFGNKLTRVLWAKRLDYLMKEGPDTNVPKKLKIK